MPVNSQDTSARILAAAADLFARNAYAGVSVDQVADHAGCTKVTVYQHFKSKDRLAIACLRLRLDRREAQMDGYLAGISPGTDPLLAVFDWLEGWLDPASFHGCAFVKAVNELSEILPEVRGVASEAKDKVARRFAVLAESTGRSRPAELGRQLALLFEGAQSLALIQLSARPARLARRIAGTILSQWELRGQASSHAAPAHRSGGRSR